MSSNIRIVLVGTTHPGNIGASARAMKTMGLNQLYLVNPKLFPHADATAMAAGATDILENAVVTDSLSAALNDCHLILGTSTRMRGLGWPLQESRQCAQQIVHTAATGNVAIIFGREHAGLTNEELDHCHCQVKIPCDSHFSSLNLAAAVQVICYEIYMATQPSSALISTQEAMPSSEELELLFCHLEKVLIKIDFLNPEKPKLLMRRLRRLLLRQGLLKSEVDILRGILVAVEKL